MKKDPIITKKPSTRILKMQRHVEFEFVMAIASMNLDTLRDLLDDEGTYFGKYSKYHALNFFRNQFCKWRTDHKHIHKIDHHIATGWYCGKSVLVFEDGKFPTLKKNQKGVSIILFIEEGIIYNLEFCTNYITDKKYNEISQQN